VQSPVSANYFLIHQDFELTKFNCIDFVMTTYILNFYVLNSLFDRNEVYCVTQVFKLGIKIKTMCPCYTREFRNTKSHLLQA